MVNSMLCFIHNFRHHPHLDVLIESYFSQCVNDIAKRTLIDLLHESKRIPSNLTNLTLFELYDNVMNINPSPLFVAADLTTLPIVLIGDQNQNKSIFNEIHQLRFFIQSALSGTQQTSKRSVFIISFFCPFFIKNKELIRNNMGTFLCIIMSRKKRKRCFLYDD